MSTKRISQPEPIEAQNALEMCEQHLDFPAFTPRRHVSLGLAVTVPGSQPMVRPDGRAAVRLETRQLGSIAFEVDQLAIDALRQALAAVEKHLRLSRKPEIDASGRPDRLRLHPFLPQHLADSTYRLARALLSPCFPLARRRFPGLLATSILATSLSARSLGAWAVLSIRNPLPTLPSCG